MAQIKGKYIENNTIPESKLYITNNPTNGYILSWNAGSQILEWVAPTSADAHDVKATINDTTPSFLNSKLLVTSGKLTKTLNNSGANETLTFNIGDDVFDKTADDTDDVDEGTTNLYFTDARADARITLQKGAANGIAPLNASSKIDSTYLPAFELGDIIEFADIDERDAYTTATKGDMGIVIDASDDPDVTSGGATYIYDGTTPYATTGWIRLRNPDAAVTSVNTQIGDVVLDTDDIDEGSNNLYFTTARARTSISAGTGISYDNSTGVISANVGYVETRKVEIITLTSTEISNKYVDLAETPRTNTAVMVFPVGGISQEYTADFTVISNGSAVRRLNWNGLGLEALLEAGDKITVEYSY